METLKLAVGLISGTSADGVDAVLLRTDGVTSPQVLTTLALPYPPELRCKVMALYEPGTNELDRMGALDEALGLFFAEAALAVCHKGQISLERVDCIGSHGQTIRHRPPGFSLQIGNPFIIAEKTGRLTVADFRRADLARGGEGAPLVPLFHQVLFSQESMATAVVNLGGIANVTALPGKPGQRVLAGDSGPASTLLDHLAMRVSHNQIPWDEDGRWAAAGRRNAQALTWLLAHPYYPRPFPKSTGREVFGEGYLSEFLDTFRDLSQEDCFCTLTALTVETVAQACEGMLLSTPDRVVLCGGGARNGFLVQEMKKRLAHSDVVTSTQLGVDADFLEASAFAWFAVRTLQGLPSNMPEATGAREPAVLGSIHLPGQGYRILQT